MAGLKPSLNRDPVLTLPITIFSYMIDQPEGEFSTLCYSTDTKVKPLSITTSIGIILQDKIIGVSPLSSES